MHYHRIAGQFFNRPLLLLPHAADTISHVFLDRMGGPAPALRGRGDDGESTVQKETTHYAATANGDGSLTTFSPSASRFYGETPMSEDGTRRPLPYRRTAEGVAIVTCVGEWVNRGGYVGASSGVISYEGFKYQLEVLARDPRSRAVIIDMESPGGEAVGAFEAAAAVRALAAIKPVWAVVNGLCASAMYAIASGASRIISMPTGITGSIGVVLAHLDYSEWLKNEGIKPTFIHAGARKVDANPYQPLPESVRDRLQAEVEDFFAMFVSTVAIGRTGLTEKAIRATEAGTFMGAEALELGLVDQIGTFEQALSELSYQTAPAGRQTHGSTSMNEANRALSLSALGGAPGAIAPIAGPAATVQMSQDEFNAALAAERAKGKAEGEAGIPAAVASAVAGERARIGAITGGDAAKGRAGLAHHFAFSTDMSADAANAALAAAPAAAAGKSDVATFEASVADRKDLTLDAEAPAPKATEQAGASDWSDVVAEMGFGKTKPSA